MQSMSAKDAKYGFGRLIDLARSEPVTVEKHGRPVVVVMAVEEYERLRESADSGAASLKTSADAAKRRRGTKQV
ncbi:MAG: type II toxin-antitoxin system Phd/YefM family antitoxin [Mesorhizobium sp.]|nr:MAG: type II toxin-antitoxin system Phd/YefM family antitoxin [Mesorhizobium sp.]